MQQTNLTRPTDGARTLVAHLGNRPLSPPKLAPFLAITYASVLECIYVAIHNERRVVIGLCCAAVILAVAVVVDHPLPPRQESDNTAQWSFGLEVCGFRLAGCVRVCLKYSCLYNSTSSRGSCPVVLSAFVVLKCRYSPDRR